MYRLTVSLFIAFMAFGLGFFSTLFYRKARQNEFLIIALLSFSACFYSTMAWLIQNNIQNIDLAHSYRLFAICGPIMTVAFTLHLATVFAKRQNKRILQIYYAISTGLCLMSVSDFHFFSEETVTYKLAFINANYHTYKTAFGYKLFSVAAIWALSYSISILWQAKNYKIRSRRWLLAGFSALYLTGAYDLLWVNSLIDDPIFPLFEFGFLAFAFCIVRIYQLGFVHEMENFKKRPFEVSTDLILNNGKTNLPETDFVRRLNTTICANMHKSEFGVAALAQKMFMHPTSLNRNIRKYRKATSQQYLGEMRLKEAARQLTETSERISLIAFAVGFNDLSYFNKTFRKQFGCTPTEYRQQNAQQADTPN